MYMIVKLTPWEELPEYVQKIAKTTFVDDFKKAYKHHQERAKVKVQTNEITPNRGMKLYVDDVWGSYWAFCGIFCIQKIIWRGEDYTKQGGD